MIQIKNITKYYKTDGNKKYIFKNLNLMIPDNISVGIMGRNGVGKSTLLRMLGGIDYPNGGEILSTNSFSWPMGLSGGFQGSMTGRQNVKFVCRIYGKDEEEIRKAIAYVIDFAELGDYFDMPIKSYSSGMRGRLSFGLSLAFNFDYLIIDETLSTGDENFRKKATSELKKKIENCNILLVSHSMGVLREMCDAGIVIHDGVVYYYDNIADAIDKYHKVNMDTKKVSKVQTISSSSIYCDDGNIFDDVVKASIFYNIRPFSIDQALSHNNGSHIYLHKVFYKDGMIPPKFQIWKDVNEKVTLLSSDGIVFKDYIEAEEFYVQRMPDINIEQGHLQDIMSKDGFSEILKVKFYYLSEYK